MIATEPISALTRPPAPGVWRLSPIRQYASRSPARRAATAYEPADVRVLSEFTRLLQPRLAPRLSRRCTHVQGHGGLRGSVRQIHAAIRSQPHRFVFRTDVRGYYDAIDPDLLTDQLRTHLPEPGLRSLLQQYLHRCVHRDGVFRRVDHGIPPGCPLSPLMAALYLTPLDRAMEALAPSGVFYVRYLDDLVVLAPNRCKLRRAIRVVNEHFAVLKLTRHPDKTFIGKLSRGFDALGSRFDATVGCRGPSPAAVQRFATRIVERYAHHEGAESLRHYVNRWLGTQTFGLSFESPNPQPKPKTNQHHHENRLPRPSPRCPEKNHTGSSPAGLP